MSNNMEGKLKGMVESGMFQSLVKERSLVSKLQKRLREREEEVRTLMIEVEENRRTQHQRERQQAARMETIVTDLAAEMQAHLKALPKEIDGMMLTSERYCLRCVSELDSCSSHNNNNNNNGSYTREAILMKLLILARTQSDSFEKACISSDNRVREVEKHVSYLHEAIHRDRNITRKLEGIEIERQGQQANKHPISASGGKWIPRFDKLDLIRVGLRWLTYGLQSFKQDFSQYQQSLSDSCTELLTGVTSASTQLSVYKELTADITAAIKQHVASSLRILRNGVVDKISKKQLASLMPPANDANLTTKYLTYKKQLEIILAWTSQSVTSGKGIPRGGRGTAVQEAQLAGLRKQLEKEKLQNQILTKVVKKDLVNVCVGTRTEECQNTDWQRLLSAREGSTNTAIEVSTTTQTIEVGPWGKKSKDFCFLNSRKKRVGTQTAHSVVNTATQVSIEVRHAICGIDRKDIGIQAATFLNCSHSGSTTTTSFFLDESSASQPSLAYSNRYKCEVLPSEETSRGMFYRKLSKMRYHVMKADTLRQELSEVKKHFAGDDLPLFKSSALSPTKPTPPLPPSSILPSFRSSRHPVWSEVSEAAQKRKKPPDSVNLSLSSLITLPVV